MNIIDSIFAWVSAFSVSIACVFALLFVQIRNELDALKGAFERHSGWSAENWGKMGRIIKALCEHKQPQWHIGIDEKDYTVYCPTCQTKRTVTQAVFKKIKITKPVDEVDVRLCESAALFHQREVERSREYIIVPGGCGGGNASDLIRAAGSGGSPVEGASSGSRHHSPVVVY